MVLKVCSYYSYAYYIHKQGMNRFLLKYPKVGVFWVILGMTKKYRYPPTFDSHILGISKVGGKLWSQALVSGGYIAVYITNGFG